MRRGTLLVLIVLVGVLFFLWRRKEREIQRGGPELAQFPLCPALVTNRVKKIRIDHLERAVQITLERDAAGVWYLTDPIAYPAQPDLVRSLLQSVEQAVGEPEPQIDAAQVALDPPLAVLEIVQAEEEGERTFRIEIGAVDLDPSKIYVRVPGHPNAERSAVFRTVRTLSTTLDRNPDDYRDPRVTRLIVQQVTSFRRRGTLFLAEEGRRVDLKLDALLEPEGWKRVDPPLVSLDPVAIQLLARGAAEIEAQRFVDDAPRALEPYGLATPALTIELEADDGSTTRLLFGRSSEEDRPIGELAWSCMREGYPYVFEVRARDVELLTRPAHLLYDYALVRAFRQDVTGIELEAEGERRALELKDARWTVREIRPDGDGPRFPADQGAVEDVLALIERSELGDYLEGVPFEPDDPPRSFSIVTRSGARFGGRIGAPSRNPESGAEGRLFLREGDELVGLIGTEIAALAARPLDSFRAKRVHDVQESQVRWIELTRPTDGGAKTFAFVNDGNNRWSPKDERIGAPSAFTLSLDPLLHLEAQRWLDQEDAALEEPIEVVLHGQGGKDVRVTLARGPEGTALVRTETGELAEIDPDLFARLSGLFAP